MADVASTLDWAFTYNILPGGYISRQHVAVGALLVGDNIVDLPASIVKNPLSVVVDKNPDAVTLSVKSWALSAGLYKVTLNASGAAVDGCGLLLEVPASG